MNLDTDHLKTITYQTEQHVALITLNRPNEMNAFNMQMRADFAVAQQVAEADEQIRIIIITGSGKAFSAGTDLKELGAVSSTPTGGMFDISIRDYKPLIDGISNSDKIYLAAINGFAGGVALGLALGADLALMADNATVFSPFADIGLVPDGGASYHLFHSMGYKRAFATIAECTRLDASTCLELGMVNKVVAADSLHDQALAWAHQLAQRAPLSLRYTKRILRDMAGMDNQAAARLESEYQMRCANSEDAQTAIMAFINKQKPTFTGR